MAISKDLLDIIDNPVYYINWNTLEVVKEILIPSCQNDWTWYSYKNDMYLIESEIYQTQQEAAEFLLGKVIAMKNDYILYFYRKEQELIELVNNNVLEKVVG